MSWTFYRDSAPLVPFIGAEAPYPTSILGVWRQGKAPMSAPTHIIHFINAARELPESQVRNHQVSETTIPPELCGATRPGDGGCVYLQDHEGNHSWQK